MGNEDINSIIRRAARPRPAPRRPTARQAAPAPTRAAKAMSPAELELENGDLRQRLQQKAMVQAFTEAGKKARAFGPQDMWRLIDPAAVKFGVDGSVLNAEQLVTELKQRSPGHFAPPDPHSGAGSADAGGRGRRSMPVEGGSNVDQWLRRSAGR